MGNLKLSEEEKAEILKKHKDAVKQDHDKKEEYKKGLQQPEKKSTK